MSEGIDIYVDFQTVTNWQAIRSSGIEWAYHKLSDGTWLRPDNNAAEGRKAGVLQGGYHFSQPGFPVDQANILVSQCQKYGALDLAPALDLEDNPASLGKANIPDSEKAGWAVTFGHQIEATGNTFNLYANDSTMSYVQPIVRNHLPKALFWVAQYSHPPINHYDTWQYSSSGHIPGIAAQAVDRSNGTTPLNHGGNDMFEQPDRDALNALKDVLVKQRHSLVVGAKDTDNFDTGQFVLFIDNATNQTVHKADEILALVKSLVPPTVIAPSVDLDILADKIVARLHNLVFKA